ncbi:MAG: hypothetical protein ACR2N5_02850 [Solirubrobacterales bacterium]
MGPIYEMIGRLVVGMFIQQHRRKLQIGGVAALVAILVGAYLSAARKVEEG